MPKDNALIEAFNGRFREEYFSESRSLSLKNAEEKVEYLRQHYNRERPYGALNNLPPIKFVGGLVWK